MREILDERNQYQRKREASVADDRFFTRPEIASRWAGWVKAQPFYRLVTRVIDPAAGARALSRHFPQAQEYDLNPKHAGIVAQDFLTSNHGYKPGTLVIMNPPFGSRSDLAVRFFNHAAGIADHIAGIFPRSFRRGGMQSQLDRSFHLLDEWVLPQGAFYLPDEDGGDTRRYDVPAVAQIWARNDRTPREVQVAPMAKPKGWEFTTPDKATFAFRRKGRRAGEVVVQNANQLNPNSFYFVLGDDAVLNAFMAVDWSVYGQDVMGSRYITKAEIVNAVEGVARD